jgi:hypothetical protein
MTTKPKPKYQGCAILRYLSLAVDAYARGTTPDEVERHRADTHPALVRLGRAASKQNGGRE